MCSQSFSVDATLHVSPVHEDQGFLRCGIRPLPDLATACACMNPTRKHIGLAVSREDRQLRMRREDCNASIISRAYLNQREALR